MSAARSALRRAPQQQRRPPIAAAFGFPRPPLAPRAPRAPSATTATIEETPQTASPRLVTREWEGLAEWRQRGLDRRRAWGDGARGSGPVVADASAARAAVRNGKVPRSTGPPTPPQPLLPPQAPSLVETAVQVLHTPEPELKAAVFYRAWLAYHDASHPLPLFPPSWEDAAAAAAADDADDAPPPPPPPLDLPARPARPDKPLLVAASKDVPPPGEASGVSAAAHHLLGVAHVELNAIDLAADTIARFAPLRLPARFYEDHARVADDEGRHLSWCLQRLRELGVAYGDLPAHDGLWRGCDASKGDLSSRLVVVPMSQEARGLDAGHRLAQRLVGLGDARSAAIVARIAEEERAHVAVGVAWFERVCGSREGVDPGAEFRARLRECGCVDLATKRSTFNHAERERVGLRREWYDAATWDDDDDDDEGAARALLPPLNAASPPELLAQLRARLAHMVELEAGACAPLEIEERGF